MPDPTPKPVTPTEPPADPEVYGGHWGQAGDAKPGVPPPDRPAPIDTPAEAQGESNAEDPQD